MKYEEIVEQVMSLACEARIRANDTEDPTEMYPEYAKLAHELYAALVKVAAEDEALDLDAIAETADLQAVERIAKQVAV